MLILDALAVIQIAALVVVWVRVRPVDVAAICAKAVVTAIAPLEAKQGVLEADLCALRDRCANLEQRPLAPTLQQRAGPQDIVRRFLSDSGGVLGEDIIPARARRPHASFVVDGTPANFIATREVTPGVWEYRFLDQPVGAFV